MVPGSTVVFTGEHGSNSRTYRVSGPHPERVARKWYRPEWDLDRGGTELVQLFKKVNFSEADFRGRKTTRLAQLTDLMAKGRIDEHLRWQ